MTAEIHSLGIFFSTLWAKHFASSHQKTTVISVYGFGDNKVPQERAWLLPEGIGSVVLAGGIRTSPAGFWSKMPRQR
jgi:hypothetical protein